MSGGEYKINKTTGQVVKDDGTGWKPVASVRNKKTGEILIDEGNGWQPVPSAQQNLSVNPAMNAASLRANQAMASGQRIAPDDLTQLGRMDFSPAAMARLPAPTASAADMDAFDEQRRLESERLRVPDSNLKERAVIALNTPTFGSGPRLAAGMQTLGALAATPFVEGDIIDREGISGATSQFLEEARIHQRRGREERPVESIGLEVVPAIAQGRTLIDTIGRRVIPQTSATANVLRTVGVGTGYGAAYGASQDESGTLQGVGQSAAIGGGLGAAGGLILKGAEPVVTAGIRSGRGAIASATDALVNLFGGTGTNSQQFAREVAEAAVRRSLERSGMTPERIAEAVQRFGNKPAVLAEVIGQDAVNLLTSITRRPGVTPQMAQDIIAERMGGFAGRAADDLRQTTGLTERQIAGDFAPELAERRAAAAPAYTELFEQQGNVASERLTALSRTNILGPKIREAQNAASDFAVAQGRDSATVTPLEVMDFAKRSLDDDIAKAIRNEQNDEALRLQTMQTALLGELDALTGGQYAATRELGGEAPRLETARREGGQALRPSVTRATVQEQAAALNPQDRPAFASGAASRLDEEIAGGRLDPRRFRLPAPREKVQAIFGEEAGGEFANRMAAEAELRDLASRWGPRQGSVTGTVLESGPNEALDDTLRMGVSLARGDRVGLVSQAIEWMRRRGYNQNQIDEMGRLLLSSPQEGLRRLGINLPAPGGPAGAVAANALPGGGTPPPPPAGGTPPAGTPPLAGRTVGAAPQPAPQPGQTVGVPPTPPASPIRASGFAGGYFGRQSMRPTQAGQSETLAALQAEWSAVTPALSNASATSQAAMRTAEQALQARTPQALQETLAAKQALQAEIADIQAARGGIATPEDQRLADALDALSEPTNDPVLLGTQLSNARQSLDRVMEALGQGREGNLIPVNITPPFRPSVPPSREAAQGRTVGQRPSVTRYAEGGEGAGAAMQTEPQQKRTVGKPRAEK